MRFLPCRNHPQYRAGRPISREVLKVMIWGVPPAGGPLLQLPTALASQGNSPNPHLQNLKTDRTPHSVHIKAVRATKQWLQTELIRNHKLGNVCVCVCWFIGRQGPKIQTLPNLRLPISYRYKNGETCCSVSRSVSLLIGRLVGRSVGHICHICHPCALACPPPPPPPPTTIAIPASWFSFWALVKHFWRKAFILPQKALMTIVATAREQRACY